MAATEPQPSFPAPARAGGWTRFAGWIIAALVVGFVCGNAWRLGGTRTPAPRQPTNALFARIARRIAPSVVNIQTDAGLPGTWNGRTEPDAASVDFSFSDAGTPEVLRPERRTLGSGVIVDPRGYILTNDHVVERAGRISVWLYRDSQPYPARLVGSDRDTDLALLKISPAHPLPAARLAGSRALRVGDWVLAVGSPFGLDHTVTAGIVSALGRQVSGEGEFQHFIQTDAPINPGNSGGPLVNMAGEVVGINTAIYTESYAYEGVGFALPSRLARRVYQDLLRYGRVPRGSIGVYFQPHLPPAVRRLYGWAQGVPVAAVLAGGPAARAGLRAGDVIVRLDQQPVRSGEQLLATIVDRRAGSKVQLAYQRNGHLQLATVQVAARDQLFHLAADTPPPPPAQPDGTLGLRVRSLAAARGAGQRLPDVSGVLVRWVEPGSFASAIGIRRGDIIVSLDRQPVASPRAFRQLSRELRPGQAVALALRRQNGDNQWTDWWAGGRYR